MSPATYRNGGKRFVDHILAEAKESKLPGTFIVQTRLFVTPVGQQQFPSELSDLNPGLFQCNKAFIEFMGKTFH